MSDTSAAIWARYDALTTRVGDSPWDHGANSPGFVPDLVLLRDLLSVPIELQASVRSGLHAKAVDVWVAAELRRAGFGGDEVWPRAAVPRVLPREVSLVLGMLPPTTREEVLTRLRAKPAGAVSADASVLGRAYNKQVDVVISQWARGPELLISSKRMHSSLSNNAFNRIEESYGDAHNLRGRHPLAAIGYVLLIRGDAIRESPSSAERLIDLVGKLGRDPVGYDATCVIVADWADRDLRPQPVSVRLVDDIVPPDLRVDRFLKVMVEAVLDRTPVDAHVRVRELRSGTALAVQEDESAKGVRGASAAIRDPGGVVGQVDISRPEGLPEIVLDSPADGLRTRDADSAEVLGADSEIPIRHSD